MDGSRESMKNRKLLTHLSLFSGIGGLDLAAEMAGIKTVGQCEYADFQTKVLEKHWPDVPRWRDIKTLTGESFYERTGLRTVDIVSGGFPCQPFSVAGKRKGKDDNRYLWNEMFRVIREIRPAWVVGENVPGIVNLALDTVLSDLESEGYRTQTFIIPACGVDAPHKRERVCIVAYSINRGSIMRRDGKLPNADENAAERHDNGRGTEGIIKGERWQDESGTNRMADGLLPEVHTIDTDPMCNRCEGDNIKAFHRGGVLQGQLEGSSGIHSPWHNWENEPNICRVVDGIPHRVDRIKSLGNAVVPQQFYIFFKLIADIENGEIP